MPASALNRPGQGTALGREVEGRLMAEREQQRERGTGTILRMYYDKTPVPNLPIPPAMHGACIATSWDTLAQTILAPMMTASPSNARRAQSRSTGMLCRHGGISV